MEAGVLSFPLRVGDLVYMAAWRRPSGYRKQIRDRHGGESTPVESVPVNEVFQGKPVWQGVVETVTMLCLR